MPSQANSVQIPPVTNVAANNHLFNSFSFAHPEPSPGFAAQNIEGSPDTPFLTQTPGSTDVSCRPSVANELSNNLDTIHLQGQSPNHSPDAVTSFQTTPLSSDTLAARRKQRPTALATRTVSGRMLNPGTSPESKLGASPLAVRRMKSPGHALAAGCTVIGGRVQKSNASSAKNSPLHTATFAQTGPLIGPHKGNSGTRSTPISMAEMQSAFQVPTPPSFSSDTEYHQQPASVGTSNSSMPLTPDFHHHHVDTMSQQGYSGQLIGQHCGPDGRLAPRQWSDMPQSAPAHMAHFSGNNSPPYGAPVMAAQHGYLVHPRHGHNPSVPIFPPQMQYQAPQPFPVVPSQHHEFYDQPQVYQPHGSHENFYNNHFPNSIMYNHGGAPIQRKELEIRFDAIQQKADKTKHITPSVNSMNRGPVEYKFENHTLSGLKRQYQSEDK